jgi:three-Cys-motif partner protein
MNDIGSRDSGPWVRDKLERIKRFIEIFSVGMKNKWNGNLSLIDLFGGHGTNRVRGEDTVLAGTSLIAATRSEFKAIAVCEENSEAAQNLRKHLAADTRIKIFEGDCNNQVNAIRNCIPNNSLTLAIADSNGMQLTMATVQSLSENRKVDWIIFVSIQALHLNLEHWRSKVDSKTIDAFFGSDGWREIFERSGGIASKATPELLNLYKRTMESFGYRFFGTSEIIRSDQNNLPLYCLLYASKNPKGEEFWNKSMAPYDWRGQGKLPLEG